MENASPIDFNIRNVDIVRLNDTILESNMNGDIDNSLYISSASQNETKKESYNNDFKDHSQEKLADCFDASKGHSNCVLLNGCHKTVHEEMKRVDLGKNGIIKCNNVEILNSHLEKLNQRTCELSVDHEKLLRTKTTDKETTNQQILTQLSSLKISETEEKSYASFNAQEDKFKTLSVCEQSENFIEANLTFLGYESEIQMPDIMRLIQKDLSEPYSIYTYRYFIHNWPKLCFLAQYEDRCVGAIVCKLDVHKKQSRRGYIAMLAVDEKYRKRKIGSNLVKKAIRAMIEDNADEVVLETEITNKSALKLYENLGFVRDKRLFRYYLNGVDALRLKLWLR